MKNISSIVDLVNYSTLVCLPGNGLKFSSRDVLCGNHLTFEML